MLVLEHNFITIASRGKNRVESCEIHILRKGVALHNTYSLYGNVCLHSNSIFKVSIMISLKLLYSPLSISHSCAVIGRHRVTAAFINIKTFCLVSSQIVSSRHAASKLNGVHCTNASHRAVFRRRGTAHWFSSQSASSDDMMTVFDRNTKRKQRNRTADLPDYHVYDYLKDEV